MFFNAVPLLNMWQFLFNKDKCKQNLNTLAMNSSYSAILSSSRLLAYSILYYDNRLYQTWFFTNKTWFMVLEVRRQEYLVTDFVFILLQYNLFPEIRLQFGWWSTCQACTRSWDQSPALYTVNLMVHAYKASTQERGKRIKSCKVISALSCVTPCLKQTNKNHATLSLSNHSHTMTLIHS